MRLRPSLFTTSRFLTSRFLTSGLLCALASTALSASKQVTPEIARAAFQNVNPGTGLYLTQGKITSIFGPAFSHGASAQASADNFVRLHAEIFGVGRDELSPGSLAGDNQAVRQIMPQGDGTMKFTLLSYLQTRDGIPVFRRDLRLLVRNEAEFPAVLARSALEDLGGFAVAPAVAAAPNVAAAFVSAGIKHAGIENFSAPDVVIWTGTESEPSAPVLAVAFYGSAGQTGDANYGRWLVVADAKSGAVIWTEDQIFHADITGTVKGMATPGKKADICAAEVLTALPYARVSTGSSFAFTDINGAFTLLNPGTSPVGVSSGLRGRWFNVFTPTTIYGAVTSTITPPGPANFVHNSSNSIELERAGVNAYLNANIARDHALRYNPTFPVIGTQAEFRTNVFVSGTCNAYYDGQSINFFPAGGGCPDTAFGDVVHHEYGHHLVRTAGSGQGQYGEGFGDLVGVILSDDPVLGYGFLGNCGSGIRTADNNHQYPCTGGIHDCGQLLTGCFWDVRKNLVAAGVSNYRDLVSSWALNSVVLHAGDLITPQITIDVLTLDDNDGNIFNGTPHSAQISPAFSKHNMPPPSPTPLNWSFPSGRPALASPSGVTTVTASVTPAAGFSVNVSTVKIGVDTENDGTFSFVTMTPAGGNLYRADLPSVACNSAVRYSFTASTTTGSTFVSPSNAPGGAYLAVSAVSSTPVFADDFQTDRGWAKSYSGGNIAPGLWERGVPVAGTTNAPLTDFDGSGSCYVTGNSTLVNVSLTFVLTSPTIDATSGGGDVRVNYARWFNNGGLGGGGAGDTLVVEASPDNGSSWVLIETVGPTGPGTTGGWIYVSKRIADFVTPTSAMKFRFLASDAPPANIVEAGLDAFQVLGTVCGTVCAADFDGNGFLTGEDFDLYLTAFESGLLTADFNADGFVTGEDFDAYVAAFETGC